MLSGGLFRCPWVDCLGRKVVTRKLTLTEVLGVAQNNLQRYHDLDNSSNELMLQ